VAFLSHGDTKHIMLLPGSVRSALSWLCGLRSGRAFADSGLCAQRSRSGHEQLDVRAVRLSREAAGSRQGADAEDLIEAGRLCALQGCGRRRIGYRTLPGTDHPKAAYFTRGSGHNEKAQYSERRTITFNNMERLAQVRERAQAGSGAGVVKTASSKIGIIAYGTSDFAIARAAISSRRNTRKRIICASGLIRFAHEVHEFVASHERIYVVEQNRDAQCQPAEARSSAEQVTKLRSILHFNGLPIDARSVTDELVTKEGL
jgi:2-oxoglutarate ferredoxin oxidoreductase subunit alpha